MGRPVRNFRATFNENLYFIESKFGLRDKRYRELYLAL